MESLESANGTSPPEVDRSLKEYVPSMSPDSGGLYTGAMDQGWFF
jgi:hypothetical protein